MADLGCRGQRHDRCRALEGLADLPRSAEFLRLALQVAPGHVDAANFRLLQEKGEGKFARLRLEGVNATDEALFARADFLEERADDIAIFVEELLRTWADVNENPALVGELMEQYDLLPDLPDEVAAEAVPYYTEAVENGIYPLDGGKPQDARDDIAFLSAAGQVEGDPDAIDPENYWDFAPLEAAKIPN